MNHGRYKVPFDLNGGEIPCSAEWEVSEVSKDVMTAGGLIATGNYSAWLDKDASYIVNKKDGRRVPLFLENNTFWLEALVAPVDGAAASTAPIEPTEIHLATDAAFPRLYPTEAAAGSTAHAGASSSDEMATSGEDMPALVDTVDNAPGIGQVVRTPTGLFCGSSVADLRARLIVLKAPVWGDKATLWKRLLLHEQQNTADKELRSAAEAEIQKRRDGKRDLVPTCMPVPIPPSEAEIKAHGLTHIPFKSWCPICLVAKARHHHMQDTRRKTSRCKLTGASSRSLGRKPCPWSKHGQRRLCWSM